MNIIELVLALLNQELAAARIDGAPVEIITELEAAIASLIKVHGTDVTFAQIEAGRTKKLW